MPITPSASRPLASLLPCSSATCTSWWASAQSTPTKITVSPLARRDRTIVSLEAASSPLNGSVLTARHPTSHHGNLTDQQAHALPIGLSAQRGQVLTCRRLGDHPQSISKQGGRSPLAWPVMEVLSSRVLLHPCDFDRSEAFYRTALGLPLYREYGSGDFRGVVFFLGIGFLEL